jgi:hypothetical protein
VQVECEIDGTALMALCFGVVLKDGLTLPARLTERRARVAVTA